MPSPNIPEPLRSYIAGGLAIGLLVLVLVIAGPAACNKFRAMSTQARVDHAQTGALANSASDAVNTVGNRAADERASDDLTRSNEGKIRNAEGSNAAVAAPARNAGLDALCLRNAYRDSEQCRLRRAPAH